MPRVLNLEEIETAIERMPADKQLHILGKIAASLRSKSVSRQKRTTGWDSLYGAAKGIWTEDAQEYVNRQREERI